MSKKRIFFETEEVVRKTRRGYIDLEMDYFQFYNVAFHYLASLSSNCAKDFILWVMSRVDENNEFTFSRDMYNDFLSDLSRIRQPKTYGENTLHVAIKELIENDILIRYSRGRYRVNPKLFWSDDTSKRINSVRYMEANRKIELPVQQGNELPPAPTDSETQININQQS